METTYDIIFMCSKCEMHHIATDKHDVGDVWMIPDSITTSFNKEDGWYFHCTKCDE